ncbi:triacylglycerol lipase OBL1 [Elaeis guineensis]|uniref:Uncharacterized protein LOC105041958 n=1 Tax=Elaeis guineensis var. tenera TaxID=51953 RepID=A0A6I9R024_ELAGV|nr:uncharacterized protein LOC105041958 [Elaeis guineensis]
MVRSNDWGRRGEEEPCEPRYLIVRSDKAGLLDLVRFAVCGREAHGFLESREGEEGLGPIRDDHRWVIVVSVVIRRLLAFFRKPMEWTGMLVEFLLNLLSLNGGFSGLFINLFKGKLVVPHRGSDSFISAIGHLDRRMELYKFDSFLPFNELNRETGGSFQNGSRDLMDLCMMASKLAYENANVVRNVIVHHWKMHFVEFYNCWNDYQKERSTQVFILCDKPKDAGLVLISFRGTEPFDADNWSTDFDYSWYEIPKLGKVHMGFLEALGLGSRTQVSTFQLHLQGRGHSVDSKSSNQSAHPSGTCISSFLEKSKLMDTDELIAYYAVKNKLSSLLDEHKRAKFIVTGHSLGGALAILFPAVLLFHGEDGLMKRLLGVYTFGQPRVGDRQLKRFMEAHLCHPEQKYFRMVYCNDLVPRLPYDDKTFLYKHFGMCMYYDSFYVEQNMDEEPNRNYFGLRYLLPEHLNAVWELIRSLIMGSIYGPYYKETWCSIWLRLLGLMMPGVSAHSPTNYINSIILGQRMARMSPI